MACQSAVLGLNQRLDKHVDARGDSHQDRGSTPLASTILTRERFKVVDQEGQIGRTKRRLMSLKGLFRYSKVLFRCPKVLFRCPKVLF
jgi:hypothetical protein